MSFFFFFSSRRRHTRLVSDWSSDVCSSDLRRGGRAQADAGTPGRVYVLAEDGNPKPVSVRTGVTDGSHTELVAGELEAGAAIIVGGGPRQQTAQTPESAPGARPRGPRLF